MSRYQKGKTNLDFTEAREIVSGSGISWAICKSALRSRQIATPAPHRSVFYRPSVQSSASVLERLPSSTRRKDRCFSGLRWLWTTCGWVFVEVVSSLLEACTSLQTRKPHQHIITQLLQAGCSSWCQTDSVKALKTHRTDKERSKVAGSIYRDARLQFLSKYELRFRRRFRTAVSEQTHVNKRDELTKQQT